MLDEVKRIEAYDDEAMRLINIELDEEERMKEWSVKSKLITLNSSITCSSVHIGYYIP